MIVLVDHSTERPRAGTLERIAAAMTEQLRRDVAPAWARPPVDVVVAEPRSVPTGATQVVIFDDPDHAGALGYHGRTPDGDAYARVFVRPVLDHGGDWSTTPLAVSSVISHEVVEVFLDPAVNLWIDDGERDLYALEIADPVEALSYAVEVDGREVSVSDFVLPTWFERTVRGPVDHLRALDSPLALARGGYAIVARQGPPRQVFGAGRPPQWRAEVKEFPASRTWRRLHGAAVSDAPATVGAVGKGGRR